MGLDRRYRGDHRCVDGILWIVAIQRADGEVGEEDAIDDRWAKCWLEFLGFEKDTFNV